MSVGASWVYGNALYGVIEVFLVYFVVVKAFIVHSSWQMCCVIISHYQVLVCDPIIGPVVFPVRLKSSMQLSSLFLLCICLISVRQRFAVFFVSYFVISVWFCSAYFFFEKFC